MTPDKQALRSRKVAAFTILVLMGASIALWALIVYTDIGRATTEAPTQTENSPDGNYVATLYSDRVDLNGITVVKTDGLLANVKWLGPDSLEIDYDNNFRFADGYWKPKQWRDVKFDYEGADAPDDD